MTKAPPFARTHGLSKTKEHRIWSGMKTRCYNQNHHNFKHYGARGIKVCDAWLNSFEAFLTDMGKLPSPTHTLERRDGNADYSPENCYWLEKKLQNRNRRNSIPITFDGKTQLAAEWSLETGIPTATIRERINNGWTAEQALTTPKRTVRVASRHWR